MIRMTEENKVEANEKFLRLDNLSPAVRNLQYAVRGRIVIRAGEIEKELKQVSPRTAERKEFHSSLFNRTILIISNDRESKNHSIA